MMKFVFTAEKITKYLIKASFYFHVVQKGFASFFLAEERGCNLDFLQQCPFLQLEPCRSLSQHVGLPLKTISAPLSHQNAYAQRYIEANKLIDLIYSTSTRATLDSATVR